jgi:hypothetical protein
MAFSGLYQPLVNPDDFNNVCLTPNCSYEVSNFRLDGMLNWELMSTYREQKSNRQDVFKLSLIGFHRKVASSNTADYLSVKRHKAMVMVRTLYVSTFMQNEDDFEGIMIRLWPMRPQNLMRLEGAGGMTGALTMQKSYSM